MDRKFLKKVQESGWQLVKIGEDDCTVKCPSVGCGLIAKLRQGGAIPGVDPGSQRNRLDWPVDNAEEMRLLLRKRREELALTIKDIEEICGLGVDFLSKFEKDKPSKLPSIQIAIDWANSLGFEVVLRPKDLSPLALRVLCDTRGQAERRYRRFSRERGRRAERAR